MPIEIVDDVVEYLADQLDFYGAHSEQCEAGGRTCRCCWTSAIRVRLRNAFEVERKLNVETETAAKEDASAAIAKLLDAMETCHVCGGTLALDDVEPAHCEDCSGCCDDHNEPDCKPLYALHSKARLALEVLR